MPSDLWRLNQAEFQKILTQQVVLAITTQIPSFVFGKILKDIEQGTQKKKKRTY
jgi:hypothetical protein